MKRALLAMILAGTMLFLSACGGTDQPAVSSDTAETQESDEEVTIPTPTEVEELDIFAVDSPIREVPTYTFDHEPTVEEMRAAAVSLMRMALMVEWYTQQEFEVSTSVSTTVFKPNERYAGIPYTGPNTSIYAFLSYLNLKTGRLLGDKITDSQPALLSQMFQRSLGSSCSGTAGWAILSVCNSVHGTLQSYYMVAENGWLPLGDYTYDLSTPSFGRGDSKDSTDKILKRYGEQHMFTCYALLQPADIVVWQDMKVLGHTMMATSDAVVVFNDDGTINGEESYVMIQDQRTGGYTFKDETSDVIYHMQGRVDCKYTFNRLFEEGYIPMTTAEFQGQKAYEFPEVSLDTTAPVTGIADLNKALLKSNYPLAVLELVATDYKTGVRTSVNLHAFKRSEIADKTAYAFPLNGFATGLKKLPAGKYRVTVEARVPNGELFIPATFDYTAE